MLAIGAVLMAVVLRPRHMRAVDLGLATAASPA